MAAESDLNTRGRQSLSVWLARPGPPPPTKAPQKRPLQTPEPSELQGTATCRPSWASHFEPPPAHVRLQGRSLSRHPGAHGEPQPQPCSVCVGIKLPHRPTAVRIKIKGGPAEHLQSTCLYGSRSAAHGHARPHRHMMAAPAPSQAGSMAPSRR